MGTGTLVHSLGSMNLSPMILNCLLFLLIRFLMLGEIKSLNVGEYRTASEIRKSLLLKFSLSLASEEWEHWSLSLNHLVLRSPNNSILTL